MTLAIVTELYIPILYTNAPICRVQNPALRHELSFEMGQMHSDTALYFGHINDAGGPFPVMPRGRSNSKTLPHRPEAWAGVGTVVGKDGQGWAGMG